MKKMIYFVSFLILAGSGLYVFNQLGGFNEVHVEIVNQEKFELSGRFFKGIPQDEKLGIAFKEIEEIKKANPGAALHTIYYSEPAGKLDTMEVFVGLESKWMDQEAGYDQVTYSGKNAIIATIKAHRFVMPGPLKIKNKIIAFAKVNSLPEPDIFIDQIIGPDEVKVFGTKLVK